MSEQNAPLLAIEDLSVSFPASRRGAPRFIAVDGVSLEIAANQTLGLVGESGSGKSTIGRAMLGLNPVERGSITLEGRELTRLSPAGRREVARTLTAVFQDPYSSLNPALTIGATLTEPLLLERGVRPEQARAAVVAALDRVGMPAETLDRYPRQFSGGQRQR
ncbi:MAG: ATP-binding cassette domain-containing protein, partial [Propionibacteriaceae bacterium]|nr:ATP-binding cassette domain-containing protein [Propionibacteriaceae bacterium]